MQSGIRNVGGVDPTRKTSPIAEEMQEDSDTVRLEVPGGAVCYFNDEAFAAGTVVRSLCSDELLRRRDEACAWMWAAHYHACPLCLIATLRIGHALHRRARLHGLRRSCATR